MSNPFSVVLTGPSAIADRKNFETDHQSHNVSQSKPWSISSHVLTAGLSDGVHVVTLDNGDISVDVFPTRGMGIWRARSSDILVGWNSPAQVPVNPAFLNLKDRNGLGWLEGFNELLCRCGLSFNGPPGIDDGAASPIESDLTLHGKIANLPAHHVEVGVDDGGLSVTGIVDEACLFGPQLRLTSTIRLPFGKTEIVVDDRIENVGSKPTEMQLLYHINVGDPFLEGGSQFSAPIKTVSPRDPRAAEDPDGFGTYLSPTPGYAEQVYFYDLLSDNDGQSIALLSNKLADLGFSVEFSTGQLPCFSQWKNTQAFPDGYCTGLEPATGFPNFKSYERQQGRVKSLAAGEVFDSNLVLAVHHGADNVTGVQQRIAEIQGATEPMIHREPQPGIAAAADG